MDVHSKVFFYSCQGAVTEIRRISHSHAHFSQFPAAYAAVCDLIGAEAVRLEYEDQERDRVVVSSQEEWDEALRSGSFGVTAPLRLHATQVRQNVSLPAAIPAAHHCCHASHPGPDPPALVADEQAVTLPLVAPGEALPAAPQPPSEGKVSREDWEQDDGLHLESSLSHRALQLMADGNNADALRLLREAHTVRPCQENAYNMGCCLALLGRPEEALAALEVAVALGYDNFLHMQTDEDLASLRNSPQFRTLAGVTTTGSPAPDAEAAAGSLPATSPAALGDAEGQVYLDYVVLHPDAPAANADLRDDATNVALAADTTMERDASTDQPPPAATQEAAVLVGLEAPGCSNPDNAIHPPERESRPARIPEDEVKDAQEESLYKLHELGFTNDKDNRRVLEAANWNIRLALELLL